MEATEKLIDNMEGARQRPEGETRTDTAGTLFDAAIHLVKDGEPVTNKDGTFRKRKGAAQAEQLKKSSIGIPDFLSEMPQIESITPEQRFQVTGQTTAQLIFLTGMALGGDEWKPSQGESAYMAYAWAQYYQAKGIADLPPGVLVATALLTYAGPRFVKPKTQKKLTGAVAWFKRKFRRKHEGEDNGPQSDNRDDR